MVRNEIRWSWRRSLYIFKTIAQTSTNQNAGKKQVYSEHEKYENCFVDSICEVLGDYIKNGAKGLVEEIHLSQEPVIFFLDHIFDFGIEITMRG